MNKNIMDSFNEIERKIELLPSEYCRTVNFYGHHIEIRYTKKIGERWALFDGLCIDRLTGAIVVHRDSEFYSE